MNYDPAERLRRQLLIELLERVAEEPYPSSTQMDTIEELLTRNELEVYGAILLAHISRDVFPSNPMIARLKNLTVSY